MSPHRWQPSPESAGDRLLAMPRADYVPPRITWRCPCCLWDAALIVYMPLAELRVHLARVHGVAWESHDGHGDER